jgi:hypothetical protein
MSVRLAPLCQLHDQVQNCSQTGQRLLADFKSRYFFCSLAAQISWSGSFSSFFVARWPKDAGEFQWKPALPGQKRP